MSATTRNLSTNAYRGGGSDRDYSDEIGIVYPPPPWLLRKMQRLVAGTARDVDDARDLLTALGLYRRIGDDE